MASNELSAQSNEIYFDLGVNLSSFPGVIGEHASDGHACPAFRRPVAVELVNWTERRHATEGDTALGRGYFDGDTAVLVGPTGNRSATAPDGHGRYALDAPHWTWFIGAPAADIEAEDAVLADARRRRPEPGEDLVAIPGGGLIVPASRDRRAADPLARPRFRTPLAEVITAYLNDMFRQFPDGADRAYWQRDRLHRAR